MRLNRIYDEGLYRVFVLVMFAVMIQEGEQLNLTRITRSEMGAYLCIASNSVPPSVSKRIILDVECKWFQLVFPSR